MHGTALPSPVPQRLSRLLLLLLLLPAVLPLAAPAPPPAEAAESTAIAMDPLRTGRFPVVSFDAQVTLAGVPVKGLTTRDFTLEEDGAKVDAFTLTLVSEPAHIALVIDASGSIKPFAATIRDGATAFVDAMKPDDRALVVRFNRDVALSQKLTDRRDALKNAIAGIRPDGGTKLYDGLHRGLAELDGANRYAVLFTDGRDARQDGDPDRYSERSLDEVIAFAKERRTAVFVIGVGQGIDTEVLGRIAGETGGRFVPARDAASIVQAYADVAAMLTHRSRFEYRSPRPEPDGRERTVRLARADGTAEAKRTYRVSPETTLRDPEKPPRPGATDPATPSGSPGAPGTPGGVDARTRTGMGSEHIAGPGGTTVTGPDGFATGSTEGFFVPDGMGGQTWIPGAPETVVPKTPDTVVPGLPGVTIPVPGETETDLTVTPPGMPDLPGMPDAPDHDDTPPDAPALPDHGDGDTSYDSDAPDAPFTDDDE